MSHIKNFLPAKYRHTRPENTRWLTYAIEKGIVNPIPATGAVLRSDGSEYKQFENSDGYRFIKVHMHTQYFSFYVHKCIYLKAHGTIPKNRELDHDDNDLTNNKADNIIARTTKQNMAKRHRLREPAPSF